MAAAAAAASGPGSGGGGLPSLPVGLNGGYGYGGLPVAVPAHSSAPVGVLGPNSQISSLVGAPGSVTAPAPDAGLSRL